MIWKWNLKFYKGIRWNKIPTPKIALKLIKLFAGIKDFHTEFENMIVDVQESISSSSLNESSLSRTMWTWKWV